MLAFTYSATSFYVTFNPYHLHVLNYENKILDFSEKHSDNLFFLTWMYMFM